MAYEVWDTETNNLIGGYETEDDPLVALGHALGEHGDGYVETLLLGYENSRGRSRLIASGPDLVERVRAHRPDSVPTPRVTHSAERTVNRAAQLLPCRHTRRKTAQAFWPPKPKPLATAAATGCSRATLGT